MNAAWTRVHFEMDQGENETLGLGPLVLGTLGFVSHLFEQSAPAEQSDQSLF